MKLIIHTHTHMHRNTLQPCTDDLYVHLLFNFIRIYLLRVLCLFGAAMHLHHPFRRNIFTFWSHFRPKCYMFWNDRTHVTNSIWPKNQFAFDEVVLDELADAHES